MIELLNLLDQDKIELLALEGGSKIINYEFNRYNSIGEEEKLAVADVMETGVLSKFLGCWDPDFYGGPKVREFEKACADFFEVPYAVCVNSWTSGLISAVGAIGIEPGDEVIVTPWTMCATATAILHWNAIPVFADISPIDFNIDPTSIEKNITDRTRAIIAVDIFGQSCDIDAIVDIARKFNLKVITDSAQAPGTLIKGRKTGTLADVGGFSLNYHKHIHTGEGGILVTHNYEVYERLQLIRNHGEAVVGDKGHKDISNLVGYNFRMGEIEAAIGIEQLKKLDRLVQARQSQAKLLAEGLEHLDGLRGPIVKDGYTNAYYIFPMVLDYKALSVRREVLVDALTAEGIPGLCNGYANIHLLPIFQKRVAYGSNGFPWTSDICKRNVSYQRGICPIAEELHDNAFIGFEICQFDLSHDDIRNIIRAFKKVWDHLEDLKGI